MGSPSWKRKAPAWSSSPTAAWHISTSSGTSLGPTTHHRAAADRPGWTTAGSTSTYMAVKLSSGPPPYLPPKTFQLSMMAVKAASPRPSGSCKPPMPWSDDCRQKARGTGSFTGV